MVSLSEHEIIKIVGQHIRSYTCQLFIIKVGKKELPQPFGCSVLFEFNGHFYCFTNAHVSGDNGDHIFNISGSKKRIFMKGEQFFTRLPFSGNRNDDLLDIAVTQLTEDTVSNLKERGFKFLQIDQIETGYSPKKNDYLLFVGYPATKVKMNFEEKTISTEALFFLTHAHIGKFPSAEYTPKHHIAAPYSIGKLTNPKFPNRRGPKLNGMSGSGIWHLQKIDKTLQCHLIGIFSEYHKNESLLLGTKIDLFLQTIKQNFDSSVTNFSSLDRFRK